MKITNPERECLSVPETLSGTSQIVAIEKSDSYSGIILDSPEDFVNALIVYNGGGAGSSQTQQDLMDNIGSKGDGMGAPILLVAGLKFSEGFIDKLIAEALSDLKSKGSFHRHFDYDAMGTNFFKTGIDGTKIGDKYILEICASYKDTEEGFAGKIHKPRALVRSYAYGELSVVDDWWFNVNLEDAVQALPIPKKSIKGLSEYVVSEGDSARRPDVVFKHDGNKFSLSIGLKADRYLRPENGHRNSEYMKLRGNNIVGGAWTTWGDKGKKSPTVKQPSVVLSVTLSEDAYKHSTAITPEQINLVKEARDYIGEYISPK